MSSNDIKKAPEQKTHSRVWQQRRFWVIVYTSFFSILGFLIIYDSWLHLPADRIGLLLYIGLGVTTELLSVELFANMRGSRVSAAAIISTAGILTFGPLPAALINAACGLASSFVGYYSHRGKESTGRAPFIQRSLFNIGMLTVSTALAGFSFVILGGTVGNPLLISNAVPLVSAVVASEAINILILIGVIVLQTGQPIKQIWNQNFRWGIPISISSGVLGSMMIAVSNLRFGMLGLSLFFLPILAVGYSFRLYMSNMRVYVNRLEQANKEMDDINSSLLETLGSVIDAYDVYTYGHSAQVAVYARAIADRLKLPEAEKAKIVRSALVHDIGKIGIMDTIIGKPDMLSDTERRIIERHPIISADILRQMKGLQDLIPLVRHHHERWDGHGYPAGLSGEEIPLGARVLALADTLDAMCSSRPYRKAISIETVRQEIAANSGTQFDPKIVNAFLLISSEKDQNYFKDSATTIDENIFAQKYPLRHQNTGYLKRSMLEKETEI